MYIYIYKHYHPSHLQLTSCRIFLSENLKFWKWALRCLPPVLRWTSRSPPVSSPLSWTGLVSARISVWSRSTRLSTRCSYQRARCFDDCPRTGRTVCKVNRGWSRWCTWRKLFWLWVCLWCTEMWTQRCTSLRREWPWSGRRSLVWRWGRWC